MSGDPPFSCFEIEKSSELQKLHEQVAQKISAFRCSEVEKQFFWNEPSDNMVNFVKNFNEEHAFDNYWPHITLSQGRAENIEPFEFTASKIALCHLGAHGTCAKVLKSFNLGGYTR